MASLTSDELNYVILRYMLESGFVHTAYTFSHESFILKSNINTMEVPPGALISFVQKGLQYAEIEAHVNEDGSRIACDSEFSLLTPHVCAPALRRPGTAPYEPLDADYGSLEVDPADRFTIPAHRTLAISCAWHPARPLLATAAVDGSVRLWDFSSEVLAAAAAGGSLTLAALGEAELHRRTLAVLAASHTLASVYAPVAVSAAASASAASAQGVKLTVTPTAPAGSAAAAALAAAASGASVPLPKRPCPSPAAATAASAGAPDVQLGSPAPSPAPAPTPSDAVVALAWQPVPCGFTSSASAPPTAVPAPAGQTWLLTLATAAGRVWVAAVPAAPAPPQVLGALTHTGASHGAAGARVRGSCAPVAAPGRAGAAHDGPLTVLRFARGPAPAFVTFTSAPGDADADATADAAAAAAPAAVAAAVDAASSEDAAAVAAATAAASLSVPLPLPLLLTAGLDGRAFVWRLRLTPASPGSSSWALRAACREIVLSAPALVPATTPASAAAPAPAPARAPVLDADWRDEGVFTLALAAPAPVPVSAAAATAGAGGATGSDAEAAAAAVSGSIVVASAALSTPLLLLSSAHSGDVTAVRWCPQGLTLASGGSDGIVRLWRPPLPAARAVAANLSAAAAAVGAAAVAAADAAAAAGTPLAPAATAALAEAASASASASVSASACAAARQPLPLVVASASRAAAGAGGPRAALTGHVRGVTVLRYQDPGPLPALAVVHAPDWVALAEAEAEVEASDEVAAAKAAAEAAAAAAAATAATAAAAAGAAEGGKMSDDSVAAVAAPAPALAPAAPAAPARRVSRPHPLGHVLTVTAPQPISGLRLASGSLDTTVRVWDAYYGDCAALLTRHSHPVTALAWAPAAPVAVAVPAADAGAGAGAEASAGFGYGFVSPGLLATVSHERVHVWAVAEAAVVRTLRAGAPATDVAWAGSQVACTATDGSVYVFDGNV